MRILSKLGKTQKANNGIRVILEKPIEGIENLRIRKPDPYRIQVGCCDFGVQNYNAFKKSQLPNKHLRLIERQEYEMIEFFDPDFDVLAYIVSKSDV